MNGSGARVHHFTRIRRGNPHSRGDACVAPTFKFAVTNRINKMRNTPGARLWQRNYYEHVIRDDNDHESIVGYILTNPFNWGKDDENTTRSRPSPG